MGQSTLESVDNMEEEVDHVEQSSNSMSQEPSSASSEVSIHEPLTRLVNKKKESAKRTNNNLTSLLKALDPNAEDDSEEDDDDEVSTITLRYGKDDCDRCPGCGEQLSPKEVSINIVEATYIINCVSCQTRIIIRNAFSDRQKAVLYSNI